MKKIITSALTFCLTLSCLSGCGNAKKEADPIATEIKMNDYHGGVVRTLAVKDSVLSLISDMEVNNIQLREQDPYSFWNLEGYQDFVTDFLSVDIIEDTENFAEENTDWKSVLKKVSSQDCEFTQQDNDGYVLASGVTVTRNEKDDYSIEGIVSDNYNDKYSGTTSYRILYDCNRDWNKAVKTLDISAAYIPDITSEIYEYARLDANTYAIQTSRERLLVVYEPVTESTELRQRKISELYYSKLLQGSVRTTFEAYTPLLEVEGDTLDYNADNAKINEAMAEYPEINSEGDVADKYGANDSLFLVDDLSLINPQWVLQDKSLQQAIIYKEGNLVVTNYNKLTTKYENFVYSLADADPNAIPELEKMIDIKNLVGIVTVEEVIPAEETTSSTEEAVSSENAENSEPEETENTETETEPPTEQPEGDSTAETEPQAQETEAQTAAPEEGNSSQ